MIVLPSRKLVILTPSRTASRAVHLALCTDPRLDAIWLEGPVGWDVISHDHRHVPVCFRRFRVAMLIRHPLDRLVSLWRHLVTYRPKLPEAAWTLEQYAQHVRTAPLDYYGPFRWTLHDWALGFDLAAVVHFESLTEDLTALLGLDIPTIAHVGRSDRERDWSGYYTPAARADAEAWARQDLERWYS